MIWPILFLASVVIANWLVVYVGPVWVFPGLYAPAGVYMAGLAFTFRDFTQERYGATNVVLLIGVGAIISFQVASPPVAVASAAAFLVSELADLLVYTPLRARYAPGGRGFFVAVAASNFVALIVDSVVFLWLAFGSLLYLPGQLIGKSWMTLIAAFVIWWRLRGYVLPRRA